MTERRRGVVVGGAALLVALLALIASGASGDRAEGAETIEPWSGWDAGGLATALVVGVPDEEGLTAADPALEELLARCPAADRGHLHPLTGGWSDRAVRLVGLGSIPAGCDSPLLPEVAVGSIDLAAEDAPLRRDRAGVVVAPDRAEEAAIALLLGRHAATYGFAIHAIREQLEGVCGQQTPRFDARDVGDDRWVVRASFATSDRCPDGVYGLATVDLRTGLIHPADDRAATPLPGLAPVLAPWSDRVGSR